MAFTYRNPVTLHMGRGSFRLTGEAVARHGKKALIVTTGSAHSRKLAEEAGALLRQAGAEWAHYDGIRPNPVGSMAAEGAKAAHEHGCDLILGIGGGSVMDASKGIAFACHNEGPIFDYIYGRRQGGGTALPVVLVTTTAGTGSEGNWTAVFTDPVTKAKKGMSTPLLFPKESIVDPLLLTSLPPRQIAGPGFDALSHAIESFLSARSNPISRLYSLEAVRLLMKHLPRVYADPSDMDAWDEVALANTLAGMAIGSAGCTAPHGLEHPVSGLLDVMHGEGLAAVYPAYLAFIRPREQARLARIAEAMGEKVLSDAEGARRAEERVKELIATLELPQGLTGLGVKADDVDWLGRAALETMPHVFANDPAGIGPAEAKALYARSL